MKIFVAAAYSSHVDYDTGEVFPEYRDALESTLGIIEESGHEVFCALRADRYRINDADPAEAFKLDMDGIERADVLLAILAETISAGVQTEIGIAVALGKTILLGHKADVELAWFNKALIKARRANTIDLPLNKHALDKVLAIN